MQLSILKRSIQQLTDGIFNIQQMENDLSTRFETYGIPEVPKKVEIVENEEEEEQEEDDNENEENQVVVNPEKPLTVRTNVKTKSGRTLELKHDPNDREIRIFISSPFRYIKKNLLFLKKLTKENLIIVICNQNVI